jgi:protein TonB
MDLRCLVFSSDITAAPLICQALAELGAEAEHCPDASAAIERAASESFQIVIADWDEQPNAEFLLKAARARKAAERALTLAVVSDDASVPKALQAGANSVLRKPILLNQVKDTLETARALLKAKKESPASAGSTSGQNSSLAPGTKVSETHLRAGDFLTSARPAPSAQFDTEPEIAKTEEASSSIVDPLKELEPMAAAVTPERPVPTSPPQITGTRGLQWYLNQRAASLPSTPPAPMPAPPPPQTPDLMGYDQMAARPEPPPPPVVEKQAPRRADPGREQRAEAELFSYIAHGSDETKREAEPGNGPRFHLGTRAIAFAVVLAACAMAAAPQAPWHPAAGRLWIRGQRTLHGWLNPQVVEPPQAPETHENFGRAGDEYKLPVIENIPDATTDPSQIRVVPVVDPTAKKPGSNGADQSVDGSTNPVDSAGPADQSPVQVQPTSLQPMPAASGQPGSPQPAGQVGNPPSSSQPSNSSAPVTPAPVTVPPAVSSARQAPVNSAANPQAGSTAPPRPAQKPSAAVQIATANPIPPSLRSQLASTVPDASGNKALDTALPAIEPVAVSEAVERALLVAQPAISYPADAEGQQGTVILQLLIGRDGSVQDAKFLQGSLAFARAAIDGVRSWKFKPYLFNGRPVSVQTQLTLSLAK